MLRFEPIDGQHHAVFNGQLKIGDAMSAEGSWLFFGEENSPIFAEDLRGIADELDRLNGEKK